MLAQHVREDFVAAAVRPEVEACVRALLADHLGVDAEQITPEVSLVDDLAADSLDLVEIALAIEGNLGVILPHQFLDRVRTCGDLVDETLAVVRRGRPAGRPVDGRPQPHTRAADRRTRGTSKLEAKEHACSSDLTGRDDGSSQEA